MTQGNQTGALWQAEGWGGEGEGREILEGGDIGVPVADFNDVWQKTTKFCKAIIIQLKHLKKTKENKHGPQIRSVGITWELARKGPTLGTSGSDYIFLHGLQVIYMHNQV